MPSKSPGRNCRSLQGSSQEIRTYARTAKRPATAAKPTEPATEPAPAVTGLGALQEKLVSIYYSRRAGKNTHVVLACGEDDQVALGLTLGLAHEAELGGLGLAHEAEAEAQGTETVE